MPLDSITNFDWSRLLAWRTAVNVIDILIVAFFIYQLMRIVKGTRAVELLKGIGVILLLKVISVFFQLYTTEFVVDFVIQWSALALIIIFQPELRRGLEHLGRGSLFGRKRRSNASEIIVDNLSHAIQYMSKRRIGALISIEMETGLDEYIATGIPLNAELSSELLINIFIPNTPLHDGAVIIKDYNIATAASYLPLSESPAIPKKLGTRHRAAIGLSEVSDAITIIVSEETGEVSISRRGNLINDMTQDEVLNYLTKELVESEKEKETQGPLQQIVEAVRKGVSSK
ncbi:diadenylate cyclase CdaA [Alkalibacterium pelagium]|uniref:Diadenylate cyclase n=1 Tax=Alkalibacterium pelagium TaxID=426702 RepID=A0A1H7EUK9_9LACT|nr:diadenylate cyclase CdaA [Alkalibacterium pelagium]GEN49669.1 membrane protein [Alkalibacterium pelagium]SEK17508.1 diadenylate cyclase [Alkalibacterium pelagium]